MPIFYTKEGQPVQVPPEQAADALASGQVFVRGPRIEVYSPDGKFGTIDSTQALNALSAGYRLEEPEERLSRLKQEELGGIGGQIAAGAAGALRGATLGISDPLLTGLSGNPEATKAILQGVAQANPVTSGVAEVGGAIAGALAIPASPAGAASRLGAGASKEVSALALQALSGSAKEVGLAKRALAKMVGMGAGGSVEGALYGAGQAVSESVLEDKQFTAESLLATIGSGALIGGAVGSASGLAAEAIARPLSNLAKKAAARLEQSSIKAEQEATNDLAAQLAEAAGVSRTQTEKIFSGWGRNAKERIAEFTEVVTDPKLSFLPDGPIVGPAQSGEDALAVGRRIIQSKNAAGKLIGTLDDQVSASGQFTSSDKYADLVKEVTEKTSIGRGVFGDDAHLFARLEPTGDIGRSVMDKQQLTPTFIKDIEGELSAALKTVRPGGPAYEAVREIRTGLSALRDQLVETALPPETFATYMLAKKVYRSLATISDKVPEFTQTGGKSWGEKTLGNLVKTIVFRAPWGPASIARGVAGSVGLSGVARFLSWDSDPVARALASHKIAAAGTLAQRSTSVGQRITAAVEGFIKAGKLGQKAIIPGSLKAHADTTGEKNRSKSAKLLRDNARALSEDPQKAEEIISAMIAPIQEEAPETAQHLALALGRALSSIPKVIPATPLAQSPQPLLEADELTKEEESRLLRVAQALQNPLDVVEELLQGIPNKEGLLVLQEVYPSLFDRVKVVMAEQIAAMPKKLTSKQRLVVSRLFGPSIDSRVSPEYIARSQMVYQQGQKQTSPSPSVPSSITLDKNYMLPGDKEQQ